MKPFQVRLPKRFKDADIAVLKDNTRNLIQQYDADAERLVKRGEGLILLGPPGVGKTFALAALTKAVVGRLRLDHEFVTASEMYDLVWAREQVDIYRDQPYRVTYARIPWLVINDLGKEYRGGKLAEQVPYMLGRILRCRSEKMLPTFISTNADTQLLREAYGESITSLLSEMCKAYQIQGHDLRRTRL